MKTHKLIIALALALPAGLATAQPPEKRPPGPPPGEGREQPDRPPGPPPRGERPPPPPVIAALDKNGDGVISEEEIASAAESLRTLDKNHDGKLTIDELLGPPPRGMRPPGDRPPGPPPEQLRDGPPPRGEFGPPPGAPREGAMRGTFGPQRGERIAANRDAAMPPHLPPRDFAGPDRSGPPRDFAPDRLRPPQGEPRDGETRVRAFAQREGGPGAEFNRPPERALVKAAQARNSTARQSAPCATALNRHGSASCRLHFLRATASVRLPVDRANSNAPAPAEKPPARARGPKAARVTADLGRSLRPAPAGSGLPATPLAPMATVRRTAKADRV